MRKIKYNEALAEATMAGMEEFPNLFLMGEGIDDVKGAFGTALPAYKKYGPERVFDSPLSENAVTGIAIGAAIQGTPSITIHMRNEFLLYAMDQIVNHAAKWRYMSGGETSVPIVIRCIVGRGWGQAAQHSQSFHAFYAHVPGLKVILPATPYDAKGLMLEAIRDPNPVISIEHRWLYGKEGHVPEEAYTIPIGKAEICHEGKDITCVAISHQLYDALEAREQLAKDGIEMEVINLRSVRPLDYETITQSVRKTGRLIVTDIANATCGTTAEISAFVAERAYSHLKAPVCRIALPDGLTPCSYALEKEYYPEVGDIVDAARKLVTGEVRRPSERLSEEAARAVPFSGPF